MQSLLNLNNHIETLGVYIDIVFNWTTKLDVEES